MIIYTDQQQTKMLEKTLTLRRELDEPPIDEQITKFLQAVIEELEEIIMMGDSVQLKVATE